MHKVMQAQRAQPGLRVTLGLLATLGYMVLMEMGGRLVLRGCKDTLAGVDRRVTLAMRVLAAKLVKMALRAHPVHQVKLGEQVRAARVATAGRRGSQVPMV